MAITKEEIIARIEVVGQYKFVQLATETVIKEDGVEISRSRHRKLFRPNDDISSEDAEVQAVCNAVWTDDVKASWTAFQAEQQNNL